MVGYKPQNFGFFTAVKISTTVPSEIKKIKNLKIKGEMFGGLGNND